MNYIFNIYSLINLKQGLIKPDIIVGTNAKTCDLFLINPNPVSLMYSYCSFSARSKIMVGGFQKISPNTNTLILPSSIQTGDIIACFENNIAIYYGYILKTTEIYSSNGRTLSIEFDTLLSHFTRQNMIQSFQDVQTLAPAGTENLDLVVSRTKVSSLLTFMMQQSVYSDVNNIFKTIKVQYNAPNFINANTEVFYYPSTQSTKEQVLLQSTYIYQVVIYQDSTGDIIFTLPSANLKSSYSYDTTTVAGGDINLRSYQIIANEAELPNNVVVSLIYAGYFPQPSQLCQTSIPNPKFFPRSSFLYTSGFFSQVELDVESLQSSIITDPTLLNLLVIAGNGGINTYKPSNVSQIASTVGLLSQRKLASELTYSRYVMLELERNLTTAEIPIGKTFTLNNEQWLCINASIDLILGDDGQSVANTLKLVGVPLYSVTGAWQ